jgi:hypothetical protein
MKTQQPGQAISESQMRDLTEAKFKIQTILGFPFSVHAELFQKEAAENEST